jgi:hypothetical protein
MKRFAEVQSRDDTPMLKGLVSATHSHTWRNALSILLSATFASLISGTLVAAHPFPFDTSKLVGFDVLTAEDGATKSPELVVVKYEGPIAFPMAENLQTIWHGIRSSNRFKTMLLRLNSEGGTDVEGRKVIQLLRAIRGQMALTTLVGDHDLCASMCVPVYVQGDIRIASPASSWMFHGASRFMSNIPSLTATEAYFGMLSDRKIDANFIEFLFDNSYVTTPGAYWMSGSDLAARSIVITKLLPNWRPADPHPGPWSGLLAGI